MDQQSARANVAVAEPRARWLLAAVILLGAGLILHDLGSKSLWFDEIVQAWVSSLSIPRILEDVAVIRGQPPLYWVLLHFFTPLGRSEFSVRLLSALFGIVNISLVYKMGKTLFGPLEGTVAAFLLAISPLHLKYAQDARMYSALVCFSLSSLYWLYRAMRENRPWLWTGFSISTACGLWTHAFFGFVFGAEAAFASLWLLCGWFKERKKGTRIGLGGGKVRWFVASTATISLAWTPILISFRRLGERTSLGIDLDDPLSHLPNSVAELAKLGEQFTGGGPLLLIVCGILAAVGVVLSLAKHKKEIVLLALWVAVPALGFSLLTASRGSFHVRYVIYLLPLVLLAVARGVVAGSQFLMGRVLSPRVGRLQSAIAIGLMCAILVGVAALTAGSVQAHYASENEDFRGLARFLEHEVRPDDLLLTVVPACEVHALDRNAFTWYYEDRHANLQRGNLALPELQDIVLRYPRTWVVGRRWALLQLAAPAGAWIQARFDKTASPDFAVYSLGDSSPTWQAYREGLSLVSEADRLRQRGLRASAASMYREALEETPDLFAARLGLAQVLQEMGKVEDAAIEWRRVVDLEPDNSAHYFALAEVYEAQGKLGKARSTRELAEDPPFEDLAAHRASHSQARQHLEMGDAHMEAGELAAGVAEYETAIELADNLTGAHMRLGDVWSEQGRWSDALEKYIAALVYKPELAEEVWFLMRLASAYREAGQVEKATETYKRVLVLNPEHAAARHWVEELCP